METQLQQLIPGIVEDAVVSVNERNAHPHSEHNLMLIKYHIYRVFGISVLISYIYY